MGKRSSDDLSTASTSQSNKKLKLQGETSVETDAGPMEDGFEKVLTKDEKKRLKKEALKAASKAVSGATVQFDDFDSSVVFRLLG